MSKLGFLLYPIKIINNINTFLNISISGPNMFYTRSLLLLYMFNSILISFMYVFVIFGFEETGLYFSNILLYL